MQENSVGSQNYYVVAGCPEKKNQFLIALCYCGACTNLPSYYFLYKCRIRRTVL